MVNQIYPPELQLNNANASDTKAPCSDLHLSIVNGFVPTKMCEKRDDFGLDILFSPVLDGVVPRRTSVYTRSSLFGFLIAPFPDLCLLVPFFQSRYGLKWAYIMNVTTKLFQQCYRYHKL